jgi:predicted Zn finger-like uncharacterized protein
MHIICPHCTTSYAIDLATLSAGGRTVRCSRCKEVWLARPEDATEPRARIYAMEAGEQAGDMDAGARWDTQAYRDYDQEHDPDYDHEQEEGWDPLVVDSPSISDGWTASADGEGSSHMSETDWPQVTRHDARDIEMRPQRESRFGSLLRPPAFLRVPRLPMLSLTTACAGMGALALALLIWRADVVRLLPQTASFYKMVGLNINLRGLVFKDVKVTTETVDGKPVLVVEGVIVGEARQPVELPRLRFSVRDAQGIEIYAWNATVEQPVLKPGEKAWFKSKLASPPPEGRNIDVRFFNKRDISAGNV